MNFNEDKEQHTVEPKYSDPESGVEIELKKERLYKLRKTTKLVKPSKATEVESYFKQLDHIDHNIELVVEDTEENIFMTEAMLEEIIEETWLEG